MGEGRDPNDDEWAAMVSSRKTRSLQSARSTPTARLTALLTSGLFGAFGLGLLLLLVLAVVPQSTQDEGGSVWEAIIGVFLLGSVGSFILAYAVELGLRAVRDRLHEPGVVLGFAARVAEQVAARYHLGWLVALLALPLALGIASADGQGLERLTRFLTRQGDDGLRLAWAYLVLPLLAWLHLLLHEFGHFAVARMVALRPISLTAGPLRLSFEARVRWRVGWNRSWLLLLAGFTEVEDLRLAAVRQQAWFFAGGPLATLLATLASGLLVSEAPKAWGGSALDALTQVAGHSTWIGALVLSLNLLPLPRASDADAGTDGRQLLDLWRGRS